jgi:hypothetical protein
VIEAVSTSETSVNLYQAARRATFQTTFLFICESICSCRLGILQ